MYVPGQGVLSAAFKCVMYQIMEYEQILKRFLEYPDPPECGFMEIGQGIITLTLNEEFEEGVTFHGTLSESTFKNFNNEDIE